MGSRRLWIRIRFLSEGDKGIRIERNDFRKAVVVSVGGLRCGGRRLDLWFEERRVGRGCGGGVADGAVAYCGG